MYYGLDPLVASKVGLTSINNVHISGSDLVYPCMAVLPMGCSWAVQWCKEAHLAILRNSGSFSIQNELIDFRPPPHLNSESSHAQCLYLDNVLLMGLNRDEVNALEISAATALRSVGLPVHEEVEGNLHALCQGMQFDGENQMVRVSSERRSKLQQGITL